MSIVSVGNCHSLANDTDLEFGVCDHCREIHISIDGPIFACNLQIRDAASARAIAADLLEAATTIEAREVPRLRVVGH
jgi:hypothetical protein